MKAAFITSCIFLIVIVGCNNEEKTKTEIQQRHRDTIVNVSDKIMDVNPEILFGNSLLYILGDILIVDESFPRGKKGIHLFDKHTFKYITSTGIIGKGPGEIASPGRLGIDKKNNVFWAPDYGKRLLYKFPLDSVLNNEDFLPTIEKKMNNELFIERFGFLNDSIALGIAWHITSNNSFDMTMAKLNTKTNITEKFGYQHPDAIGKKSNALFAMSNLNNFYVNCYNQIDLMTICDLEGNLKYNVYGPGWFDSKRNKNSYFFDVEVMGEIIIASYIGGSSLIIKGNITKGAAPSKFILFDMNGKYLKTIETGFEFERFCVDAENKRIIAYFTGREEPLGYFDIPF
jgi:hypothetical protein